MLKCVLLIDTYQVIKYTAVADMSKEIRFGGVMSNNSLEESLINAISREDVDEVINLIKNGADVNSHDRQFENLIALHVACYRDNTEIIKYLLDNGADMNAQSDDEGHTPLHIACDAVVALETVEAFVARGVDIDIRNDHEDTPLLLVCSNADNLEVVKYLISKGADINAKNYYGNTPLRNACSCGTLEIVKYLVECGVELEQRDYESKTALMIAKKGGYTEIVEILKAAGAKDRVVKKPVKQKSTKAKKVKSSKIPLIAAIKDNNIVEAFHLIEAGHDVWDYDEESYSVFDYACKGGHLDLIKKMVEHGYTIDSWNGNPF